MSSSNANSKEEYLKKLRHSISETRKKSKVTQEQLASIAGISQARISNFENGSGNISAVEPLLICKVLNFSINSFLEEYGDYDSSDEHQQE